MRELVAVLDAGGPDFPGIVQEIWDAGDALLPIDARLPEAARARLLAALRPTIIRSPSGERRRSPDGIGVLDGDALVIATSGATGSPKGAVHTHDSVAASALATNTGMGVDPTRDCWLACLPVAHVAGFSVVARALANGTPLVVHPHFDADAVMAAARDGATLTTLVPTALGRIDPTCFRRIVVGAAAPPARLPPNCVVSYGLTETGSAVCYDGRPLLGAMVRAVDGELWVAGPMLLRAYRTPDGPEGRDPRTADGWFRTGDAGTVTDDGTVVVEGRRDDVINTGGEKVWPAPVEAALLGHPGVADAAVVGRPDPQWGAQVVALVVPADPATPPTLPELRSHVKASLPPWAAPRALELVTSLPRTALGKLERHRLTAPAVAGAEPPPEAS